SGGNSNYSKEDASRTLGVDKTTSQVKQTPGAVKKLSVAVAVDSKAKSADPTTIQNLIGAAAGIDAQRGDTVAVQQVSFDDTAAKQAQKELKQAAQAKSREGLMSSAKTGVVLLVVGLVLFLL